MTSENTVTFKTKTSDGLQVCADLLEDFVPKAGATAGLIAGDMIEFMLVLPAST